MARRLEASRELSKRVVDEHEDLSGVVLDPARLRIGLREVAVRGVDDVSERVDRECPHARRPRVDGEQDAHARRLRRGLEDPKRHADPARA